MNTTRSETAPVSSGCFNFAFSENGRYGTCVRMVDECQVLERWTLSDARSHGRVISGVAAEAGTHALPLDDGRILLLRPAWSGSPRPYELSLLRPDGDEFGEERLGTIPSLLGGYLLPSPNPLNQDCAVLGFVVALDCGNSTIWRIATSPTRVEVVAHIPGLLDGGAWLDGDGPVLAANQTCGRYPSNGIAVDLARQSWKTIWSRSVTSADRIVLANRWSKTIIVSTTVAGQQRLGWARIGNPTVHFPDVLHRPGYERHALALDDRGERLLVHEVTGAVSRLFVYTLERERLVRLPCQSGQISPPARWTGEVIQCRFSAPTQPPTLATMRFTPLPEWSSNRDHNAEARRTTPRVELTELQGRSGPIEAIVYGGPRWRAREYLVVALHGGPLSAWRFTYEPLFQRLSEAGVAVVAPNYRGSTGYGAEHLRAVIGNWGGPDLDDVLDLGRELETDRAGRGLPRPVVLGMSYGAFLALLAACHGPRLWSACVALAPFLSGPSFYDSANIVVRRRIQQLGGLRRIEDAIGPRDALRACSALSAPLLLMHGVKDETIPVSQSRTLRRRLLELGRIEGVDFEYVETDSAHGELLQREALSLRVARFCRARSELDSSPQIGKPRSRLPHRASSCLIGKWNR